MVAVLIAALSPTGRIPPLLEIAEDLVSTPGTGSP